jgi:hypothetical protein
VGNTIYAGGVFESVGRCSGQGVRVNRIDGAPVGPSPELAGTVSAVASDGEGGWYVGGEFTDVGGQPRAHLAHILRDGTVADWSPNPDGWVAAIVVRGNTVYVGGEFQRIAGKPRSRIAALNGTTGEATAWNPGATSDVLALAVGGDRVYAGGYFSAMGGKPRASVAALDARTGRVLDWNPSADRAVEALAVRGNTVYVGGEFATIGGRTRKLIAALDARTGAATTFDAQVSGTPPDQYAESRRVNAIAIRGDVLYVGGLFDHVGEQPRNGLAAVDARTGRLEEWDPALRPAEAEIAALAADRGLLYVAGVFSGICGVPRNFVAAVDVASGTTTSWNPRPNWFVNALAVGDDAVYLGGIFSSVWDWQPRRNLAALDATTGEIKPWNPNPDGVGIYALAAAGDSLIVGGAFNHIGGLERNNLAIVDTVSGVAIAWNPRVNSTVSSILSDGDRIYLGGYFTVVGGQGRDYLAAVDRRTGEPTDWNPGADWPVFALAKAESTVYVGGLFGHLGGRARDGIGAVEVASGDVTPWDPKTDLGTVYALAVDGRSVVVGGGFDMLGGQSRNCLGAVDMVTGLATSWDPKLQAAAGGRAFPEVKALALNGRVLYVGGEFGAIGDQTRGNLAAVDLATGSATAWDPEPDDLVWALTAYRGNVYAGGRFARLSGLPCAGLGAFRCLVGGGRFAGIVGAGGRAGVQYIELAQNVPNPARGSTTVRYTLPRPGAVTLSVYDVAGRRITSPLSGEPGSAGAHKVEIRTDGWAPGVYYYRLEAAGSFLTRKMLVVR